MRYIIVLGDGMADYHRGPLGKSTPLEKAVKPNIDKLCYYGKCGLIKTIPDGMKPASDVANLSVMGYDPTVYYSGRSPLEALSMGVQMLEDDIALRANLVTLSDETKLEDKTMLDYSAGEISTSEAKILMQDIQNALGNDRFQFYSGISYRHCLIDKKGSMSTVFTPPHDISDKNIAKFLPQGEGSGEYLDLIKKSIEILDEHPINLKRKAQGKKPASAVWFWGAGTKPSLPMFSDRYNLKGAVISAVDLIKGIAKGAGMKVYEVEGATGNIDTNFAGKAQAVIQAIKDGYDFVYLHIEAPDECGHRGEGDNKIKAIEKIDEVTGYIKSKLDNLNEEYVIAVLCDHATPLCLKTHASDPVPYLIYYSTKELKSGLKYTELEAQKGDFLDNGGMLIMNMFN